MRLRKKQEWARGVEVILEQKTANIGRQAERFENFFQWDRG